MERYQFAVNKASCLPNEMNKGAAKSTRKKVVISNECETIQYQSRARLDVSADSDLVPIKQNTIPDILDPRYPNYLKDLKTMQVLSYIPKGKSLGEDADSAKKTTLAIPRSTKPLIAKHRPNSPVFLYHILQPDFKDLDATLLIQKPLKIYNQQRQIPKDFSYLYK